MTPETRRAFAGILLVCSAFAAQALAQDPAPPATTFAEDPSNWGRLNRVLVPEFPKESLARGVTGSVDIEGTVTGWGTLADVEMRPLTPEASVFVEPLKAAIPHWRFHTPLGNNCGPSHARVVARAIFEIDNGKPKISVEHAKVKIPGDLPIHMKAIRRVQPKYPDRMLPAEIEGVVYTLMVVDSSGSVTDVSTRAFPFYKGLVLPHDHRTYREVAIAFDGAISDALRKWEFPPATEPGKSRTSCFPVIFRIRD